MVLGTRFRLSIALDLALMAILSKIFTRDATDLRDEFAEAINISPTIRSSTTSSPWKVYTILNDGLWSMYLVLSSLVGVFASIVRLNMTSHVAVIITLILCAVFGFVAAQFVGHGLLGPIAHRGSWEGRPWGDTSLEANIVFPALFIACFLGIVAILYA